MSIEGQTETNLPIKREMFCQYYVKNDELRGNATMCYAKAYHYKLDQLPDDDEIREMVDDGCPSGEADLTHLIEGV